MKKFFTLILAIFTISTFAQQADTLVKWSFTDSTTAAAFANGGLPMNADKLIETRGGTSALVFTYSGYTTKSVRASGWDNGMDTKYWLFSFESTGYNQLYLFSRMKSSNTGPKNFKIQYTIDTLGSWTDVPNGNVVSINDTYVSGNVSGLPLPAACDNQAEVFVRYIMTSDSAITAGTLVAPAGTCRMDDIFVVNAIGTGINTIANNTISVTNANNSLYINAPEGNYVYQVMNVLGETIVSGKMNGNNAIISLPKMNDGYYFVTVRNEKNSVTKKFVHIAR